MTITKLERIAWLSARDRDKQFDNVMHLFTEEALAECFHSLDGRKAMGADGVTKKKYGENLAEYSPNKSFILISIARSGPLLRNR